MASIQFYINQKDPNTEYTINILLRNGRKGKFKKSTEYRIIGKHWDPKKQAPIAESKVQGNDYYEIRRKLPKLKVYLLDQILVANHKDVVIDGQWLTKEINAFLNRTAPDVNFEFFTDYADYYIDNLPNKILKSGITGVSPNTIKTYNTTMVWIGKFEKYRGKRLKMAEVGSKFHKDFIHYLHNLKNLNFNTTGKYLSCVKSICLDAKRYGLKISPDVENGNFKITREKTTFITLSPDEINTIFDVNLKTQYLENARDWLIIGVWTGARVSDLLYFTKNNVRNNFIEYTAQKTGQKIILPLHPQVKEVLNRNNGDFPRTLSPQKFNDYIKDVCKDAGINAEIQGSKQIKVKPKIWRKAKGVYKKWELVSTHICRRSFATNHYGLLPTPVIMAVTGHTTEKQFLKYIGKTAMDNAEVLNEFWQTQEHKKEKKPRLEVLKTAN